MTIEKESPEGKSRDGPEVEDSGLFMQIHASRKGILRELLNLLVEREESRSAILAVSLVVHGMIDVLDSVSCDRMLS